MCNIKGFRDIYHDQFLMDAILVRLNEKYYRSKIQCKLITINNSAKFGMDSQSVTKFCLFKKRQRSPIEKNKAFFFGTYV